jgi:hypothetical protein
MGTDRFREIDGVQTGFHKVAADLIRQKMQDRRNGLGNGGGYCIAQSLPELIEDQTLNADQMNPLRRPFRIEPPSDLDGLPHTDTMATDRSRLHNRKRIPAEDVNGPRNSP